MPDNAVYVGRGSAFGNPFRVYQHCKGKDGDWGVIDTGRLYAPMGHGWTKLGAVEAAINAYRSILDEIHPPASTSRYALAQSLKGKDLACFCPLGRPCHADVLLSVANGGPL